MAEVPFTPAPNFQAFQPNPLQQMGQMQHMMLQAQALEKAQQEQAARNALGQIMSQHVNQETGDIDLKKVIVDVAKHPEAQPLFGEIYPQILATGKAKQEEITAGLATEQKKMETAANVAATLEPMINENKESRGQQLTTLATELMARGVLSRPEGLEFVQKGMQSQVPVSAMLGGLKRASQVGQEAIRQSFEEAKWHNELIDYQGPDGTPLKAERWKLTAGMNQFGGVGQQNAAAGGMAPSPGPQIGGGGNPSQPASPGIRTGTSAGARQMQEGQINQFNDTEKEIRANAQNARAAEPMLNEIMAAGKYFESGPGSTAAFQAASVAYALGQKDVAKKLLGGDEKALAAMQVMQKYTSQNAMRSLRDALGGGQRITNMEVQNWFNNNPNLETTPEAMVNMANFLKKQLEMRRLESHLFQKHKELAQKTGRYDAGAFDQAFLKILKKQGLLGNQQYRVGADGRVEIMEKTDADAK